MRHYQSLFASPYFYIALLAGLLSYWLLALALVRGL